MTNDWLAPHALVVPVDYATYCAAEVARDADLFLVDHTAQFLANRDVGNFDGYPEPAAMIGEALARGRRGRRAGSWRRTWARAWRTWSSARRSWRRPRNAGSARSCRAERRGATARATPRDA